MKASLFGILAALSSIASAAPTERLAPWQGPSKFLISITASIADHAAGVHSAAPVTYYLSQNGDGSGTKNPKDAASCSINIASELICSSTSGPIKISSSGFQDMVPLASNGAIKTGFSVDGTSVLRWESKEFMNTDSILGKAKFALYPSGGKVYLYANLGCPTSLHFIHMAMTDGTVNITPVT